MSKKGTYIVIEGLDGCGKGTQREKLVKEIPNNIVVREPGGTEMSEEIRNLIQHRKEIPRSPLTNLLLFSAARANLIDTVVRPKINEGVNIISDRSWLTGAAYQQSEGVDIEDIRAIAKYAIKEFFIPDITIFIDVPASVGLERMFKQDGFKPDFFEQKKIDFFETSRKNYLKEIEKIPNSLIIDGTPEPDQVWESIKKELKQKGIIK